MPSIGGQCTMCRGALSFFGPRIGYTYCVCDVCGTLQLHPMPTEGELEAAYAEHYVEAEQAAEFSDPAQWKTAGAPYRRDILRALVDHGVTGRVVDFGAGWGFLCKALIEHGFDCEGTELSSDMAAYAIAAGVPVRRGGFDLVEALGAPAVDAIVMCAVFEHLSNHHGWMRRFNRRLRMGGTLVTLHPTAACFTLLGRLFRLGRRAWELPELHGSFAPPWHTALVSLRAMDRLAEESGFQVLDVRPASQGRIGGALGVLQRSLEFANRLGWMAMGRRWPLVTTHVFVLRKIRGLETDEVAQMPALRR